VCLFVCVYVCVCKAELWREGRTNPVAGPLLGLDPIGYESDSD
jgi:hypothetical protein